MEAADCIDPARLFGREVFGPSGQRLGRVTALVHHGDGCDVLIERRHWLKHTVLRVDIDELVEADGGRYVHRGRLRRLTGPRDGWVA